MNELTRASHDEEIERLHNKLAALEDPSSEEYAKILKAYDILVRSANEDDRVQAEARAEELRIEVEADKLEQAAEDNKKRNKLDMILGIISPVASVGMSVTAFVLNLIIQKRAMLFEERGYAFTTQSSKNLIKMPQHKI